MACGIVRGLQHAVVASDNMRLQSFVTLACGKRYLHWPAACMQLWRRSHELIELVHCGLRHVVEEEAEEDDEQDEQQQLEDGPLPVVPDDVLKRLQRVGEPQEGRVGTTGRRQQHAMTCQRDVPERKQASSYRVTVAKAHA